MRINYFIENNKINDFDIELTERFIPSLNIRDFGFFSNHFISEYDTNKTTIKYAILFDIKCVFTHKKNCVNFYSDLVGFTDKFINKIKEYDITKEQIVELKKEVDGFKQYEVEESGIVKVKICT